MLGESSFVGDGLLSSMMVQAIAPSIVPHQRRYITTKWLQLGEVAAANQTWKYLKLVVNDNSAESKFMMGRSLTAKGSKQQFAQHTQQITHSMGLWLWVAAQFAIVPLQFTWQWIGNTTAMSKIGVSQEVRNKRRMKNNC
jgi:hypothetical protein